MCERILTSDPADLRGLARAAGVHVDLILVQAWIRAPQQCQRPAVRLEQERVSLAAVERARDARRLAEPIRLLSVTVAHGWPAGRDGTGDVCRSRPRPPKS